MAVKRPILEIPVDDEKFKRFYALYSKYKESAAKSGADSEKLGKKLNNSFKSLLGVQEGLATSTRTTATYWSNIASSTKSVYGNISGAVNTLMRWTGIGTAVAGLAAGGSVWGLDRLAGAASAGRRSSSGLGLRYGQQQAFGISYERLIDSAGFLGGVSTARGNVASGPAHALYSLGMNPAAGGNTADVAMEALKRVRQLAQNTPDEQLGMLLESRRLGELGLNAEDLRRIKGLSESEFGEYGADYAKRAGQLDVGDKSLKQWQDFYVQLDAAGSKIKTALIDGLTALAKPLTQLSDAFGDAILSLLGSNGFKDVINTIARGLQTFADYVKRDEFQNDVKIFAESIEMLAKKTVAALRWLGLIPGGDATPSAAERRAKSYSEAASGAEARRESRRATGNGLWDWISGKGGALKDWMTTPIFGGPNKTGGMDDWKKSIAGIESAGHNNPYGVLGPLVKGDQAHGKYQVMGANIPSWTQSAIGRAMTPAEFLADPAAQEKVFEKIFGDYVKKYGSPEAAARAWFAGEGGMNNRGAKDVLGTSVQGYSDKFNAGMGQPKLKVEINNNTGGSAIVTTSGMGIPNL